MDEHSYVRGFWFREKVNMAAEPWSAKTGRASGGRAKTAIVGAQCSVPDLNCDDVCSVFRAEPQPRSGEFSTSTAIL